MYCIDDQCDQLSVTNNRCTAAVNILTFRLFLGYSNSQNVGEEGRRHARALLLHTLNAKYNTCQFLEVHYIHQLAGYARNYVTITKQQYWLRWSDPHLSSWPQRLQVDDTWLEDHYT